MEVKQVSKKETKYRAALIQPCTYALSGSQMMSAAVHEAYRTQAGLQAQHTAASAGATPAARNHVRFEWHALQAKLESPAPPEAGSAAPATQSH